MSETKDTSELTPNTATEQQTDAEIVVDDAEPAPVVQTVSAGQMLRDARLASGMHIGTLSLALKVPVKKLEALESDDWAQLPDAVFVRALATSVCRQIKADSAPILAALPLSKSFQGIDEGSKIAIQPSFHSPADSVWRKLNLRLSLPMLAGAMVLLLAALLLIFLPDFVKKQSSKKVDVVEKIEPIIVPEPAAVIPATAASAPSIAQEALPAQTPLVQTPSVQTPSVQTPAVQTPPVQAPAAAASKPVPDAVLPLGVSILRMVAKGEVWVEVKDSKGVVLVQRTMQPKEVINASGAPPLAVVIGRINEMQAVEVRGKPFNLTGLSPDNVARFEVK